MTLRIRLWWHLWNLGTVFWPNHCTPYTPKVQGDWYFKLIRGLVKP